MTPALSWGYPWPMNPFSLFLVLAIVGAILALGAVVVTECRDAEPVVLPATVTDKAVLIRERTVTTTAPAGDCPACPGGGSGGTRTVTTVVQEETFVVTLNVAHNGKPRAERIEVSPAQYATLKVGDEVRLRILRGKTSGRLCSRPEILGAGAVR